MSSTMAKVKHLPANGGRAFALLGHTLSFKAESEDTDDRLFLFEHRMPATLDVPAHTERNHESFYMLRERSRSKRMESVTGSVPESFSARLLASCIPCTTRDPV